MFQKILRGIKTTPRAQLVVLITAIVLLAQEIFTICIYAVYKAQMFDGYAANGIFQLLDPMRRLHAGQTIGRNFEYFHGPFTMLLHYPIFLLFGHNLYAASMAEWLISPLVILLVVYVFARIVFPRNWAYRLLTTYLVFSFVNWLVPVVVAPNNSLLGIRLMGPVLLTLAFWYSTKTEGLRWRGLSFLWDGIIPFLIAFALLTGTEFGLAAVAAGAITYYCFQQGRWFIRVLQCARMLAFMVVYLILLAAILSKGAPFSILRYSFVDIPADQFWYFGAPPNPYLVNIWQMFKDRTLDSTLIMLIALCVGIYKAHRAYRIPVRQLRTLTFLVLAGLFSLLPMFGYFFPPAQAQPLRFYIVISALLLVSCIPFKQWKQWHKKLLKARLPNVRPVFAQKLMWVTAGVLVVLIIFVRAYNETVRYHEHNIDMHTFTTVASGSHLAQWWEYSYKAQLAGTAGLHGKDDVWSMYVGLLDAVRGTFNPAGYDYIIHALGPQRRADYLNTFTNVKPSSVITLQTIYFAYEPWLENEHWQLYNQLFTNYKPVTRSNMAVTWRKNSAPWQPYSSHFTNQKPMLGPDQKTTIVNLPGGSPKRDFKLYTFEIDYDATNKLAKLPYIGKMPRFLVSQSGLNSGPAVSLPPYQHSFSFPVLVRGSDKEVVFHFITDSLMPGAHFQITLLKWRQEDVPESTLQTMYANWVTVDIKKPHSTHSKKQ